MKLLFSVLNCDKCTAILAIFFFPFFLAQKKILLLFQVMYHRFTDISRLSAWRLFFKKATQKSKTWKIKALLDFSSYEPPIFLFFKFKTIPFWNKTKHYWFHSLIHLQKPRVEAYNPQWLFYHDQLGNFCLAFIKGNEIMQNGF